MPRQLSIRRKFSDVFKRRDGQLYAVLQRQWASWLYPGAIVEVSIDRGMLLIQGPERPRRPINTPATKTKRAGPFPRKPK
jgi:hypothetical protein